MELFGDTGAPDIAIAPLDVPLTHLLLEMLLQAGLVGKLPGAVGALERTVQPIVGRLKVVIEKPLLCEVFVAPLAHKRPLTGMDSVVHIQMGFSSIGFLTDAAYKRLFTYKMSILTKGSVFYILPLLPVCILMCSSNELLSLHAFSHTPHMKLDTLVWVVM